MVNLFYDSYRILSRVYGEKSYIKQAINSEVIEPINKNTVIKICYGVVERDIELEYIIKNLCDKRPKLPIRILIKISIYCIKYLQKTPYSVTDSAVELCKKLGKGGMSGFLNAVLRKFVKNARLSVKYSYPEFAVKEIIENYGEELGEQILSFDEVLTYLRFNDGVDGADYLLKLDKDYEITPFKNCFALKNFNRDEGFFDGTYTFQSIGSVAICDIVESGEKLIDACAAPGGKSVALSPKFKEIVSCELHEHRAKLIVDYANRMKVRNISVKVQDSTVFNPEFNDQFDGALCDCPCSGFGVVKENPDIKINREYDNLLQLTEIQLKIIQTCSIFKKENDFVIKRFLESSKDFCVEQINSPLNHLKTTYGLQFLPNISSGAGFYICKLRKL